VGNWVFVQIMSPIDHLSVSMSVRCIVKKRFIFWMPFGMIGRLAPKMRQVHRGGYGPMARGNFGGECEVPHCNQWGLCCIVV